MIIKEENFELRKLLWLNHNKTHILYGADAGMQCPTCHIDFERDSIEIIKERLNKVEKKNECICVEIARKENDDGFIKHHSKCKGTGKKK